jgi:hypothetical protein
MWPTCLKYATIIVTVRIVIFVISKGITTRTQTAAPKEVKEGETVLIIIFLITVEQMMIMPITHCSHGIIYTNVRVWRGEDARGDRGKGQRR